VFVQVTGIKLTNGGNSAVAEYTWKYHNTTQMYQLIKDTKSAILNWGNLRDEIEKGTLKTEAVRFSLYDDGWRIAQ
jgi:hypothetical protein